MIVFRVWSTCAYQLVRHSSMVTKKYLLIPGKGKFISLTNSLILCMWVDEIKVHFCIVHCLSLCDAIMLSSKAISTNFHRFRKIAVAFFYHLRASAFPFTISCITLLFNLSWLKLNWTDSLLLSIFLYT